MSVLSVAELYDLYERVSEIIGSDDLLSALALANRQGSLEDMLDAMGMSTLLGNGLEKPMKVLVIGASQVSEGKLRAVASKQGFDPNDFEFFLEYDRLKHFNFSKLRYSNTYAAVLVGPQPHSTSGKSNAGSAIAEMESRPDVYPQVIRMTDSNELKITASSFRDALERIGLGN